MVQTSRYIIQVPRFTELLRQMEFIAYRIGETKAMPIKLYIEILGFNLQTTVLFKDFQSREKP